MKETQEGCRENNCRGRMAKGVEEEECLRAAAAAGGWGRSDIDSQQQKKRRRIIIKRKNTVVDMMIGLLMMMKRFDGLNVVGVSTYNKQQLRNSLQHFDVLIIS